MQLLCCYYVVLLVSLSTWREGMRNQPQLQHDLAKTMRFQPVNFNCLLSYSVAALWHYVVVLLLFIFYSWLIVAFFTGKRKGWRSRTQPSSATQPKMCRRLTCWLDRVYLHIMIRVQSEYKIQRTTQEARALRPKKKGSNHLYKYILVILGFQGLITIFSPICFVKLLSTCGNR